MRKIFYIVGMLLCMAATSIGVRAEEDVTIGFIVKMPEEVWFQLEWKFAEEAAKEKGFKLVKISGTDGTKVLGAIDNLAALGAQGFVICTPDVLLGPAIIMRAKKHDMKVIAVDDRFIKNGRPMEEVHYLGISARKIGELVGKNLLLEMNNRGWSSIDTGVCIVTYDELETARERTQGTVDALLAGGFPKEKIFYTAEKTTDVPGGFDATNILLTQHPGYKHWMSASMNDNSVIGSVRAFEGRGYSAENIIGIGIGGTDCVTEFKKNEMTGFFGAVLLSAKQHGYDTVSMMYDWITKGKEPQLDTRTAGVFLTRDNFESERKAQGIE